MTFPSVYFNNHSSEYTPMPYSIDSCFKYIATKLKDINSLVIWRDSTETEELTKKRIKKLKKGLDKYCSSEQLEIHSMGKEQKISRHTINKSLDKERVHYLLSLNSVFEVSGVRFPEAVSNRGNHVLHPKIWCMKCWKNGFHLNKRGREIRRMDRQRRRQQTGQVPEKNKGRRHLVWTGWSTGFHWSTV